MCYIKSGKGLEIIYHGLEILNFNRADFETWGTSSVHHTGWWTRSRHGHSEFMDRLNKKMRDVSAVKIAVVQANPPAVSTLYSNSVMRSRLIFLTHTLCNVMQNACCSTCILNTIGPIQRIPLRWALTRCSVLFCFFTGKRAFSPPQMTLLERFWGSCRDRS